VTPHFLIGWQRRLFQAGYLGLDLLRAGLRRRVAARATVKRDGRSGTREPDLSG
jgi:hypothetical protein